MDVSTEPLRRKHKGQLQQEDSESDRGSSVETPKPRVVANKYTQLLLRSCGALRISEYMAYVRRGLILLEPLSTFKIIALTRQNDCTRQICKERFSVRMADFEGQLSDRARYYGWSHGTFNIHICSTDMSAVRTARPYYDVQFTIVNLGLRFPESPNTGQGS